MATGQSTASALATISRPRLGRRLMGRAERTFARLSKGFDEYHERTLRAYEIAGFGLADQRSLKAYREEGEAFARLRETLRGGRLREPATGLWRCHLRRAATDGEQLTPPPQPSIAMSDFLLRG